MSRDPNIRRKVSQIAAQEKESRIVIPFSYKELSNAVGREQQVIFNRLREYFYQRDLFAFDSPLRSDTYFFGRSQAIQHLYGKYKSGENACLFGLRKIGKTSALFALRRQLELRDEPSVFLDCSETSFHRRRWNEALYYIVENLAKAVAPSTTLTNHAESFYTEKDASRYFEEDLKSAWGSLGRKRLLIILDEIENITFDISPSDHWAEGRDYIYFWQALRSIYQKNKDLFSFIVAGVNPKALETPEVRTFDNPIFRLITPMYLPLFTVREVQEMVQSIGTYMGMSFGDEVFTYLVDDFGGHPFLVRHACSKLHKVIAEPRPVQVTKFRYHPLREALQLHIRNYVELIVQVLRERYTDEYDLLMCLARGDHKTFNEFVTISRSIIDHLEGYGLVQEENGAFHFKIRAVENYLRELEDLGKALLTKEDKWREITTKRNNLESALRRTVKVTLKMNLGLVRAKEAFLEVVSPPDRQHKLSSLSLDEIFADEVYFEDLRKLVVKRWSLFVMVFGNDRVKFDQYMQYVNQHRVDAHASDIDDESLTILLMSLQWLQSHIDEAFR